MGFALRTPRFVRKPLAISLILQQLAGETPGLLLLSLFDHTDDVYGRSEPAHRFFGRYEHLKPNPSFQPEAARDGS